LTPNPFYQVYAVAALAVEAEPVYVPATLQTGFLPDYRALPKDILNRTTICYVCSPSNPQGAVATRDYWADLIALAEEYDFTIFADEENIKAMKSLRNYAGAPLALPLQRVAEKIWADEEHVEANRALYREKLAFADDLFSGIQGFTAPQAGFFLWLPVADGEAATKKLWVETGVKVLPGGYLGRDGGKKIGGGNPGDMYIRAALVAPMNELQPGLQALKNCIYG